VRVRPLEQLDEQVEAAVLHLFVTEAAEDDRHLVEQALAQCFVLHFGDDPPEPGPQPVDVVALAVLWRSKHHSLMHTV
jgi:hypothetical protein